MVQFVLVRPSVERISAFRSLLIFCVCYVGAVERAFGQAQAIGDWDNGARTGQSVFSQPSTCDKGELKNCKRIYKINKSGCADLNAMSALKGCQDYVKDKYQDCKLLAGCQ